MVQRKDVQWGRSIVRIACLVAAMVSLAGCVVYPAGGYYRGPGYHYYYR